MNTLPRRGRPAPGSRRARSAHDVVYTQLTGVELVLVTERLRDLAQRLAAFHDRLGAVEAAIQPLPGVTSCSSRDSRSSKRLRSS